MESNEVLERLPRHLMSLVIEQPYNDYTAQDHAVWRYVMRQNVRYLPHVAHSSYLDGLKRTGISIDRIPHMYGMNRILSEIGWAAVAVDGFIPPSAFMEFQAYNVLVIAADIRPVDQIQYTPAPDIIHEAAGHAPIIADPVYAAYLRDFGKIGTQAFSSVYDQQIYEAIRHLSILKADPYSTPDSIEVAEAYLERLTKLSSGPSEMSLLRNLHWWTVEYGLIGELNAPRIYGAGLLSSIGESYSCLQDQVKKIPYSLEAQNYNFDITTRQPQLFVTPDFETLTSVLTEFEGQMALRKGGLNGILKAINSGSVATVTYTSGIQVSGIVTKVFNLDSQPSYISIQGPAMLGFSNQQLSGHGVDYHKEGFGSPVGFLKNVATPLEFLNADNLSELGLLKDNLLQLEFESGVKVSGKFESLLSRHGKTILISLSACLVKLEDTVLFEPGWGMYDMAVGAGIISCYSGAFNPDSYGFQFPVPEEKTHKIKYDAKAQQLHAHYQTIRNLRENGGEMQILQTVFDEIESNHSNDWLLPLEMHELLEIEGELPELSDNILRHLKKKSIEDESLLKLIQDGLAVEKSSVSPEASGS